LLFRLDEQNVETLDFISQAWVVIFDVPRSGCPAGAKTGKGGAMLLDIYNQWPAMSRFSKKDNQ
jgi:hypothetical protein